MKFFAVFAAILAVACGYQTTWTLQQLSDAIQNPHTDAALIPHLEHALNQMMEQIFAGETVAPVTVTIPAIDFASWSLSELSEAIQNPETDPTLLPYLVEALNQMMLAIHEGHVTPVVAIVAPATDLSYWSLQELSDALNNPQTNAALIPYLEHALNQIMGALMDGSQIDSIVVATPAGLLPGATEVIPVVPAPTPAEEAIVPAPSSSPLVQIIINVNAQAIGAAPAPAVTPEIVADKPEPIIVVDQAPEVVKPEPVIVAPTPIAPEPVIVANPVVVPSPVVVNPVDVVAVNPEQVNPVDVLHPLPVVSPVAVGVGPMI